MNISEVWKAWEGRMVDGRLPLRQWLGGSDHSCVFLTELAGPDSPKAVVKIFPGDFFDPDRQLSRWRAAAQLNCPSLLGLLDGGLSEMDGTPFFFVVMEFVEEDLSQILSQRPLTAGEVTELLPPLLEGLAYLHQKGFVHGHIQPSNIMASGSQLKLPVDRIYAVGETREIGGLSSYDAPEVTPRAMSPATDVWALGITLIAAFKQHPPALGGDLRKVPEIPTDIPEPLRSLVSDCLTLEPERRCTIAEITAWLQPVPARIVETVAAPAKSGRSGWRIGAPIAAIVLIGAMVLGQKLLGHRDEPAPAPKVETKQPAPAASADSSSAKSVAPAAATTTRSSPRADSQGSVVHQVIPDVSAGARKTIRGKIKVSVQVDVDPAGKVTEAKLVSPGPSKYFANLAVKSARQWEFSAPQNNREPVPSVWMLRFQFGRAATEVFPARVARP